MKKFLLSLFGIITLGLVNFGSCEKVSNLLEPVAEGTFTAYGSQATLLKNISYSDYGVYCISVSNWSANGNIYNFVSFGYNRTLSLPEAGMYLNVYWDQMPATVCFKVNQSNILVNNTYNYNISFDYQLYRLDVLLNEDLPVMTSLECQTEYNLIPVSSVDSNYCEINGLCPACPVCPELSGGFSNFYVYSDGIYNRLSGTYNYYVNIPDYLDYSYDYSNGGEDLDLDIGVAVDTGYIDGVIDINSYRPSSGDFTDVFVGGLTLIIPYVGIILFFVLIWKLLKKLFKF